MRLIDADELKIDYGFTWDDIVPTHDEMYALIDRQPTIEPEPHWIPCSERLPDEYGEYKITWTTSYLPQKRFISDSEFEVTGEFDHENHRFKGEWLLPAYIKVYPNVKVIAWMPLPEPYMGGEQE